MNENLNKNPSEIIEEYAEKLPLHEHIKLIERLEQQLIKKQFCPTTT